MGGDSPDTKSTPKGAVFISYASQDSVEAQHIADALRKEGVEAWFDRSELRGGDAWDGLIRRQIHDCRLFIAIISSHTESRDEGYFRREWKLAVERTHDLAEDVPFLIPVVIDDTREATARVPDRFREVHWTRLTDQRPADLAVRIRSLIGRQGGESRDHRPDAAHAFELRPPRRRFAPAIAGMLVIAVVLAGIIEYERRPPTKSKSQVTTSTAVPDSAGAPLRSIAVLPFVNMSGDPNQEYFSDGLTEELIDLLIRSTDLRVPASTSSFYFKGKQATIAQIASALSVSYVLEGSVRKSGNRVRITGQLIDATTGAHLWADRFDGTLEDIFDLQDEVTVSVVGQIAPKVEQAEIARAKRKPTESLDAYDCFLRGMAGQYRWTKESISEALGFFYRAIELDPDFASAYGVAAWCYVHRKHW
jgi:TolB-like protein